MIVNKKRNDLLNIDEFKLLFSPLEIYSLFSLDLFESPSLEKSYLLFGFRNTYSFNF